MISKNYHIKINKGFSSLLRKGGRLKNRRRLLLLFLASVLIVRSLYNTTNFNNNTNETRRQKEITFALSSFKTTITDVVDNDNHNHNYNNDSNNVVIKIIIGAGLGTTGTHLMYKTTCYMGYQSVHYNLGCIDLTTTMGSNTTTSTTTTTTAAQDDDDKLLLSNIIKQPFHIHKQLIGKVSKLTRCLQNQQQQQSAQCGNAMEWSISVKRIIHELLVLDSSSTTSLVAFHDNPYPYFVDEIVRSATSASSSASNKYIIQPVVLLSERSPTEWLQRRIETQHIKGDIMCKHSLLYSSLHENDTTTTTTTTATSGLDLLGCIDDAISRSRRHDHHQESNNNNKNKDLDLKDIFVSLKQISKNPNYKVMDEEVMKNGYHNDFTFKTQQIPQNLVLKEITKYQDHIRNQLSNFTYDMFLAGAAGDNKNKTAVATLANMILQKVPILSHKFESQKPNNNNVTFVNWWKGAIDDTIQIQ